MAFINHEAFDLALNEIVNNATTLHICNTLPTDLSTTSSSSLGTKSNPTFTGPEDGVVSGRRIIVNQITDGSVTISGGGSDSATHWALVDATRLLSAGDLTGGGQIVTDGNSFTLSEFSIEIQDPS
jgi:hypothetical protein